MCVTATAKNYLKVDAFIASLCVGSAASGIVVSVTKGAKVTFPYSRALWLSNTSVKIVVLAALILVGYILYTRTAFGKSVKSIGGNPTVARISGIHVEKTTYLAYSALGVAVSIGALFTVARSGAVDASIGSGMNLNIMIAVVLGGFPLSGGANARFSAPIIGALIVTVLTNGLAMMGQANALGYGVKGLLFIIVVVLTYEKSKGKLIN
jgi:ribose transport system permease protein